MAGPDSSYSALEIHIDWKVDSDEMRRRRAAAYWPRLLAHPHAIAATHQNKDRAKTNAQNHLPSTTPREQPIQRRRRRRLLNRNRISLLLFTSGELLLQ